MDWIEVHEADPFLINMCIETSGKHQTLHLVLVQGELALSGNVSQALEP
jgi:hypothetical protein